MNMLISRRSLLAAGLGGLTALLPGSPVLAQRSKLSFENWVEQFRARAKARGISEAVYNSALKGIKPDTSVYAQDRSQPEFRERAWQYLNRNSGCDRSCA